MAALQQGRHLIGEFGPEWRRKISEASTAQWADPAKRRALSEAVSKAKQRYDYLQYDRHGNLVRRWFSVKEIVNENPEYKWQNIYSVCHGHKPTYRGFVWKQVVREDDFSDILGFVA